MKAKLLISLAEAAASMMVPFLPSWIKENLEEVAYIIKRIQRVRPDLTEDILLERSKGLQDLEYFERCAMAGDAMPWEPEKDKGKPITAAEALKDIYNLQADEDMVRQRLLAQWHLLVKTPTPWQRVKNFFNRRVF